MERSIEQIPMTEIDRMVKDFCEPKHLSVQPEWCSSLPLQQQSVLFCAVRGPDGIPKTHPCKDVQRAYRASTIKAARMGREMEFGEKGDSFMCLSDFSFNWPEILRSYFDSVDELPHHFHLHLMHAAEILGYKHPDARFKVRWLTFYELACQDMHLTPETEIEMDIRLSDWNQISWDT